MVIASCRARARLSSPSRSIIATWIRFQAIAIGPVAAGAAIGITWPTKRAGGRDLERDHPAERAADDKRDLVDPERVEEDPLRPRLIAVTSWGIPWASRKVATRRVDSV